MNISKLNIDSYKHLQNINFDFTYPNGHEREGELLNKVCIIGQSATGKTSVLELIKNSVSYLDKLEIVNNNYFWDKLNFKFDGELEFFSKNSRIHLAKDLVTKSGTKFLYNSEVGGSIKKLIDNELKLLYLSSDLISNESVNIFNQNPLTILNELSFEKNFETRKKLTDTSYIFQFGHEVNTEIWFLLLYKILDYRKKFTQLVSELMNKGIISDLNKLNQEFNKWSEKNENPLVSFANYFNPILKKLNLEVDLINTEHLIPIKSSYNEETIPISNLSTGTKGLLLSMFPLYELDTTDSIILVDEPERSLFPDMQIDLISHYQNMAPNAQLIVATHSPFIAAAFEPEERFILYFDNNGKVAVRKGESPIGDDPNDILRNDFNVDYYNDFGKKAYKDYLDLKRKVTFETEPNKKKELVIELAELGDKYNF